MAYLKLKDSSIFYTSKENEKSIIISDIINSQTGPKSGIRYIESVDELDILFGKNFSQYDYYVELLNNNVGLLLGKPLLRSTLNKKREKERKTGYVSPQYFPSFPDTDTIYIVYNSKTFLEEQYIWIKGDSSYTELNKFARIHISSFPKIPSENIIYDIDNEDWIWRSSGFIRLSGYKIKKIPDLPEIPSTDVIYVSSDGKEYIFQDNDYILLEDLPENLYIPENSFSYCNRDTLRICSDGFWCYPRYNPEDVPEFETSGLNISLGDLEKIERGDKSISYKIDFSEVKTFYTDFNSTPGYFSIPISDGFIFIWYKRNGIDSIPPFGSDILKDNTIITIDISPTDDRSNIIQKTISSISELNLVYLYKVEDEKYIVYSKTGTSKNRNFYFLPGLSFNPDQRSNHDILDILTRNSRLIEFYSEILGNEDEKIKILIESDQNGEINITISKYNYVEIFNGSFNIENHIISKTNLNSKLVRVKKFFKNQEEFTISKGSWILSGAMYEKYDNLSYFNTLELMKISDIYEDFLLIPDVYKYHIPGSIPDNLDYFQEYTKFLDYCKEKNCQALISNVGNPFWNNSIIVNSLPSIGEIKTLYTIADTNYCYMWDDSNFEWKNVSSQREIVAPENFVWNFTGDKENRLLYFYHNIYIKKNIERPAYYVFLSEIIGNNYGIPINQILYYSPYDAYEDSITPQEEKKSNFLVDNGHYYYYKKYFKNIDDEFSWSTRFIISRLSREYQNKKWNLLGNQMIGDINSRIKNIALNFSAKFSKLVRNAEVTDISWDLSTIYITIKIFVYELVDKNINLSLTLNFIN